MPEHLDDTAVLPHYCAACEDGTTTLCDRCAAALYLAEERELEAAIDDARERTERRVAS